MKKQLSLLAGLLLFAGVPLGAQTIFPHPLSPRNANYRIEARLTPASKTVHGEETLTWRNIMKVSATELQFHLYMNAFRNEKSTFRKEGTVRIRNFNSKLKPPGGVDILEMNLADGASLLDSIEYIHPDDDNAEDSTVIRVPLPEPVQPGESVTLNIKFETRMPRIVARTGVRGKFFFMGQWFPKVGVWQENGRWNCHQFHANSEFFSDYGVYDVRLTVPKEFIVGATGIRTDESETDSTKTLTYHAEDVHDFAWTAWPDFRIEERKVEGVAVRLLYAPENSMNVERYFDAIGNALKYFGQWYMPYPYPNLTIVDGPVYAQQAMGMEYPTLITGGSIWHGPKGVKIAPEEVTVHEFGHQYFYGILGSNEFEEAWLDEGFNSYATSRVMNKAYGKHASMLDMLGFKGGDLDMMRAGYLSNAKKDIVVKPAWQYKTGGYGTFSYNKPAVLLTTLERYLGAEVMSKIMKTYFARFKFTHPTTRDFIAVVNEIAPQNMDWYFQQALFDSRVVDYDVRRISFKNITPKSDTSGVKTYKSTVQIYRNGEFIIPVDIRVIFENQDTVRTTWDGKSRYKVLEFRKPAKIVSAEVDPEHKLVLDVNYTNNTRTFHPNKQAFLKLRVTALQIVQSLYMFFSF